MDQYLNNRQSEILYKLLANPADNGHSYADNLQSMVRDFPQSGLLQAMLARAGNGQGANHAAAYFNTRALYTLVNSPDSLAVVSDEQIIGAEITHSFVSESLGEEVQEAPNKFHLVDEQETVVEEVSTTPVTVIADDERSEVESLDQIVNTHESEPVTEEGISDHTIESEREEVLELPAEEPEQLIEIPIAKEHTEVEPIVITPENESFYEDELVTEAGVYEEEHPHEENIQLVAADEDIAEEEQVSEPAEHPESEKDIEDDIFDEIVGIEDINFAQAFNPVDEVSEESIPGDLQFHEGEITEPEQKDRALDLDDEAEKLIVGNIAATDYFVFDRAISERKNEHEQVNEHHAEIITPAAEHQTVSKYHDEKMPYTFMWWLDKTRREHAGIYQPFKLDTSEVIRQSGAGELQQQYYENIFHLNAVEELDRNTSTPTIEFDMKSKEDRIIKRFIVEEPHINPPSSDKLDNENKAKKSAEDQDELVTETLARIYIDQMLYHKAVSTYKKLMLKFPEKSRYFADQIEQLERKTN